MNAEHEIEQFMAALNEFSRFYDKETQDEPEYLNDAGIKNLAFSCYLEGMERVRKSHKVEARRE